jgi:hypothetical protein
MRIVPLRLITALALGATLCGCPKVEPEKPGLGAHVARGKEKRSLENDIRQLATFLFDPDAGRTPKNWEAFKPSLRQAPHLVKAVEDGEVAIIYNVPLGSNTVVAYEREPDLRGSHVVAWGDGRVTTMPTAELDAALKAMGMQRN